MKTLLSALLLLTLCFSTRARAEEMSREEIMKVIDKMGERLEHDDIKALDEVKNLPGDHGVAVAVMYFKQYNYRAHRTDMDLSKAHRAAQLIAELPAAEVWFTHILRKQPYFNGLTRLREVSYDIIVMIHTNFGVRVLAEAISDPEIGARPGDVGKALARMNLPDAPFTRADGNYAGIPAGLAKWRGWWEAHKAEYSESAK